ncbi:dnaJ homolog subfamily C member 17-like [Rhopilema esculentum]|uniref:dnaJ homolog subfamily C member 17-like n=1 Tax=Rhopilema esculentum TaxID=499914 RepID=UPI0031D8AE2A
MAGKSSQINYYEILGVTRESNEKEIIKSYRKKALLCHPDKNPDNPKAADLFHELSEALKVLTDKKAKAAYDAVLKAKELARLRTQALDAKRKKFKQDLEAREASASQEKEDGAKAKHDLEEEIRRLREEGSKLLKEEQEFIRTQLAKERKEKIEENITPKLKVKWKVYKGDHDNGGYNEVVLRDLFEKYGNVIDVLISAKKNGLGIIEFQKSSQALIAMEFEHGFTENPLKISWLQGEKKTVNKEQKSNAEMGARVKQTATTFKGFTRPINNPEESGVEDFESMVLMRMKMAQKNKDKAKNTAP